MRSLPAVHTTNQKETAMNKQLYQALVSHLINNVADADVIALHNEHAPADDYVYDSIEEIADVICANDDPTKIARMVFFGNVHSWNARFYLDGYGNINSFNNITGDFSPVDFKLLAEQIIENEQYDEVDFDAGPYLSDDE